MLVHLTSDRQRAYVVAIPRDAWVEIPGFGQAKVNAAYSLGGPSLMVRTVEQLTDVRIDHVAVVDWHGLVTLIDSLGGLELTFADTTVARDRVWGPGTYLLSGAEVRDYVSERLSLPNGDFDRIERQQEVLRAIGEELLTRNVLGDPLSALSSARAAARSVSVDEGLGITKMVRLAISVRNLDPGRVRYLTAPNLGIGWEGDQSVVHLDADALGGYFAAFESGQLERWLTEHGDSAA
jgi:LCP family protein required for cell wall assembly